MNRTTVTLPGDLVETLRKLEGVKTKAIAVRRAVETAIQRFQRLGWMHRNEGRRLLHPEVVGRRDQFEHR